jgi:ABC-type transport system involved in cytochrome bd biosynthesis fused ATPase/permease subunit
MAKNLTEIENKFRKDIDRTMQYIDESSQITQDTLNENMKLEIE